LVVPLHAVGRRDLTLVGGKAGHLRERIRAGLPVPPGFVLTTAAYERFVPKVMADSPCFAVVTCQAPANQTLSGVRVFSKVVPAMVVV
jgi:phosphoenolpyruvate synthase/pyruvate phosphate dikinase